MFAINKEHIEGFYLDPIIVKKANKLPLKYQSNNYINQLVAKCKLNHSNEDITYLTVILYKSCFLGKKINKTLRGSHLPYCSQEDFFGLLYLTVQSCVDEYDPSVGDFKNFFIKMYSLALANEKKQSFLKITGKTSDVVNKKGFATNLSTSYVDVSSNFEFESEKELMNTEMVERLNDIPYGQLLIYKYLSSDKPKNNKQIADKFNLTPKQVRLRLRKASSAFVKENPTYLEDYCYDDKDVNDFRCVSLYQEVA